MWSVCWLVYRDVTIHISRGILIPTIPNALQQYYAHMIDTIQHFTNTGNHVIIMGTGVILRGYRMGGSVI